MGTRVAASGYAIFNAATGQKGRVAAEETGGFVGDLALGAAAIGLTVGAPIVLLGGVITGVAGALYVSAYGREAGSYYYN
ncbi:hypothetical protein [Caenimonas koreensis]|uniref:hypothetical protein n=1 Tax=Caenimonas koreensis TaxID=367474 RepID=UPI003783A4B5